MLYNTYTDFLKDVVCNAKFSIDNEVKEKSIWKIVDDSLSKGWNKFKETDASISFIILSRISFVPVPYHGPMLQIHTYELRGLLARNGFKDWEIDCFIKELWLPFAVLEVGKRYEASYGTNAKDDDYIFQLLDDAIRMLVGKCKELRKLQQT